MRRNFKLTAVLIVVLLGALIGWAIYTSSRFHIVSTSPKLSQLYATSSHLDLNFNKPLNYSSVSLNSTSDILGGWVLPTDKTLRLEFSQALLPNNSYTITLVYIRSTAGQAIKNKTLKFKVSGADFTSLPDKTKDQLINSQDNNQSSDKVYSLLPYYSSYYTLTVNSSGTQSNPDIIFSYIAPSVAPAGIPSKTQSISDAKAWLAKNGVDLNKYRLIDNQTGQTL